MIQGIIEESIRRGIAPAVSWPVEERRDLISSARAVRNKGLIPIIAEIKPKALGRPLTTN